MVLRHVRPVLRARTRMLLAPRLLEPARRVVSARGRLLALLYARRALLEHLPIQWGPYHLVLAPLAVLGRGRRSGRPLVPRVRPAHSQMSLVPRLPVPVLLAVLGRGLLWDHPPVRLARPALIRMQLEQLM